MAVVKGFRYKSSCIAGSRKAIRQGFIDQCGLILHVIGVSMEGDLLCVLVGGI